MQSDDPTVSAGASATTFWPRACSHVRGLCAAYMTKEFLNMAEEPNTEGQQEIKTAQDVRMDQLTARLDALEAENRKLREANASLYAMSNPVQESQPQQIVQMDDAPVQMTTEDVALKSFDNIMFGDKENGK